VNPSGLALNTYTGSVTITAAGVAGSPITIPVTLNVVAPQTLTVTPTSLQFAYTIGQVAAPTSQTVQVRSSAGTASFTAAATSTGNWLQVSPTSGSALPASLTVSVSPQGLTAGTYNGTIAVNSPGSVTVTLPVTLTVGTVPKPVITGITNGASGASNAISPGETIVIYGSGLGPADVVTGVLAANGRVATTLSDTQVIFNVGGADPAPLIYVWNQQTSAMVPYEVAGLNSVTVQVIYKGVISDPFSISVVPVTPGIFTQNFASAGPGLIFNSDGHTVNTPNTPAAKNSTIAVYMTGGGLTTPPSVTGSITPSTPGSVLPKPLVAVTATVAGIPATVTYGGAAPGFVAGFMQVNVTIPPRAPSGVLPLVISLGATVTSDGTPSQPGVTVAVQ
jgi:uncharacterized protein (TIGR03437 family)